ncbi:MAG: PD40 domain-containing protein [Planctomycetes bacterium]|nr:PD40 domain-containing protein [Planctomycetota bacterium]
MNVQRNRRLWACLASMTLIGWTPADDAQVGTAAPAAPATKGAFFGLAPPSDTPKPFAPELLAAVSPFVEATAFSPGGNAFFLSVGTADYSQAKLYVTEWVDGAWTPFVEPSFTAGFTYSHEPVFLPGGSTLIFTGKHTTATTDLWAVTRTERGWSEPSRLPAPINGDADEFRGCPALDRTFYFGSNRSGMLQVYRASAFGTPTPRVELVGPPIDVEAFDGDPCVAPDGRFLLFYSGRSGTSADLYVSFRTEQGAWGEPLDLGPDFNTAADEYGAHLSSDGKHLFFTRHTTQGNTILWVLTSAIDALKPKAKASSVGPDTGDRERESGT